MIFACWISKATDTHSEYVIFIAFPQQQWLRERVSVLSLCTYMACLVECNYRLQCDAVYFGRSDCMSHFCRVLYVVCTYLPMKMEQVVFRNVGI
jgi:hypothetical protein